MICYILQKVYCTGILSSTTSAPRLAAVHSRALDHPQVGKVFVITKIRPRRLQCRGPCAGNSQSIRPMRHEFRRVPCKPAKCHKKCSYQLEPRLTEPSQLSGLRAWWAAVATACQGTVVAESLAGLNALQPLRYLAELGSQAQAPGHRKYMQLRRWFTTSLPVIIRAVTARRRLHT